MDYRALFCKNPLKQDASGMYYPYPVYEKTADEKPADGSGTQEN